MKTESKKKIKPPIIRSTQEITSLSEAEDDLHIEGIRLRDTEIKEITAVSLSECELDHVVFSHDAASVTFMDVLFTGCDFSNAVFDEAMFRRCWFVRCRMLGTSFIKSTFHDVTIEECMCDYANFSGSRWENAELKNSRFADAAFSMCTLKNWYSGRSMFEHAEFADTSLSGIDFSDSIIDGIVVKAADLPGVTVNKDQAAAFAALLGMNVKE